VILKQEGLDGCSSRKVRAQGASSITSTPPAWTLDDLGPVATSSAAAISSPAPLLEVQPRIETGGAHPGTAPIVVEGHSIHVRKSIAIDASSRALDIWYELDGIPQ